MPQDVGFGFRLRKPTPVVAWTLGVLVAVWVVIALLVRFGGPAGADVYDNLAVHPARIAHGQKLWTLLTASLLHSLEDTDHLLFNGIGFYFFAPDLEERWGRGKFVLFMLLTALGGNLVVVASSLVGISTATSVVGFSGVVMGVLAAWALTFPDQEFFLIFFSMKGIHLLYVEIALQVLAALSLSHVSAAAHFGGMATGAAFALAQGGPMRRWWLERKLHRLQRQAASLRGSSAARRASGPELRVIKGGADDPPKDKRYLN